MVCLAQGAHFRCKLKLMDTFMSFLWVDISPGSTFWVEAVVSIRQDVLEADVLAGGNNPLGSVFLP